MWVDDCGRNGEGKRIRGTGEEKKQKRVRGSDEGNGMRKEGRGRE